MGKITIEGLEKIAQDAKARIALRQGEANVKITVHLGTCGVAKGARCRTLREGADDHRRI
jgi:NADP-reducing hydrogenase subunit HndB